MITHHHRDKLLAAADVGEALDVLREFSGYYERLIHTDVYPPVYIAEAALAIRYLKQDKSYEGAYVEYAKGLLEYAKNLKTDADTENRIICLYYALQVVVKLNLFYSREFKDFAMEVHNETLQYEHSYIMDVIRNSRFAR